MERDPEMMPAPSSGPGEVELIPPCREECGQRELRRAGVGVRAQSELLVAHTHRRWTTDLRRASSLFPHQL